MAYNNQRTVVVIDDSPTLATLFERAITDMDILLIIFNKTSNATEYLESNKPDLIFMNIKMPGKDGLATLKEIRNQHLHSDTPVVMVSSKDYAQDRYIAKELGAIEFITKPMPIQTIKDALIKHLNY
jgi:DNA-binding response OmpR family regulator